MTRSSLELKCALEIVTSCKIAVSIIKTLYKIDKIQGQVTRKRRLYHIIPVDTFN